MNDALAYLWPLVDASEPVVAAHVVATWPAGVHARLVELGFLIQADDADRVLCPECYGHTEEVIASDGPNGTTRFFIPCPEVHRAHVAPEQRRRWSVSLTNLAGGLAASMGLRGACSELSPSRVWRLGNTTWQGRSRDVLLGRGLHWDDASSMRGALRQGRRPIVFVAQTKPAEGLWRGRVPPLLALSQIATLGDTGIDVDAIELATAIQDADSRAAAPGEMTVSLEQLKLMIRQQLKAESKTTLTDDILVAAYRQHSSVRDAAVFLSEHTGQEVSKDKVNRAVQRAGGVEAVRDDHDSESIRRTVASQLRDRRKRFASPTQPPSIE